VFLLIFSSSACRYPADALLTLHSISEKAALHVSLIKNEPPLAKALVAAELTSPEPLYRLSQRFAGALAGSLRPNRYFDKICHTYA
jgi:hypothetical protein